MDKIREGPAITIRQPATANLMVDSLDRNRAAYPSPWDFYIQKPESIMNGYFNRIGTTELVLEWDYPTIQGTNSNAPNNTLTIWVNGIANPITLTFQNMYAITAANVLDNFIAYWNATYSVATNLQFGIVFENGLWVLKGYQLGLALPQQFIFGTTTLAKQFFFPNTSANPPAPGVFVSEVKLFNADLRRFRYIDIVSPTLTYNQDLKDGSTVQSTVVDILARWYMDYETDVPLLDKYNLPILMGYSPFTLRRIFSPPKQIRWDSIQPIGQLNFQVWGAPCPQDNTANYPYACLTRYDPKNFFKTNFLLTLQMSEN